MAEPNYPEPVPAACQLAILPFLAAVEGVLRADAGKEKLRITMHRVMDREGDGYLLQACVYVGSSSDSFKQDRVGRMFTVDTGIMGIAFDTRKVYRTRRYPTLEDLKKDLSQDLIDVKSSLKLEQVPVSYLAIPFLASTGQAILILYVECDVLNFFAEEKRVMRLVQMCEGFTRLFDWLTEEQPFPTLRNFPFEIGK